VNGQGEPSQVRYLEALRDHWKAIALVVGVAVLGAAVFSLAATKRYQASADLLVTPVDPSASAFVGISILRNDAGDPTRSVITAARFVTTPETNKIATKRLGADLSNSVKVIPVGQADIVSIEGSAATAAGAALIANTFAEATIEARTADLHAQVAAAVKQISIQLHALQKQHEANGVTGVALSQRLAALDGLTGQPDPTLHVLSAAQVPGSPVWPRPGLSIVIAALASLLLAIGVAIGLELLSGSIEHEEELLFVQHLPILARVPRASRSEIAAYYAGKRPMPGAIWEAFRGLRANLMLAGETQEIPQVIVVTSAMPEDGKSFAAATFAVSLAGSGLRVVLVDGDLQRPSIGRIFGISSSEGGFRAMYEGWRAQRDAPQLVDVPNTPGLRLLLATPQSVDRIDLLEFRRVDSMMSRLRDEADVVIIDSSPLIDVADALTLAARADAVLIAVRIGHTSRDKLNELRRILDLHHVPLTGLVVTRRERATRTDSYYGRDRFIHTANFVALEATLAAGKTKPKQDGDRAAAPTTAAAPGATKDGDDDAAPTTATAPSATKDDAATPKRRPATPRRRST
jgi:Mrp family chromosome partitioning ATPase/capsular polysaccharide biosynthesis protein